MDYMPHNMILIELNKQKLKAFINDVDKAQLIQSAILDPIILLRTAENLLLNNFTGIILTDCVNVQKVVYVKEGEVVFARSNLKDDRLGETMCRMGKLTDEKLNEASKEITQNRRLGKILVESKYITSRDLWLGVKRQILEIWGSYILPTANQPGAWFHVIQSDIDETNVVKPGSNMLDSLFEFLRLKTDFIRITPSSDDLIHLNYLLNSVTYNMQEKTIIGHLLEKHDMTVGELASDIHIDDISILGNILKPLIYTGILDITKQISKPEQKTDEAKFEELVNLTNTIMASIAEIMSKKASHVKFKVSVAEYIKLSGGMFKDCKLNEHGCFDAQDIMFAYRNSKFMFSYKEAVTSLKELIQFELFEMKNYLTKDQTVELESMITALG